MKLGFLLAAGARASFIESFELIPDGYHGTYQNWNVTQLLVENEDDELFQAFEEEVNWEELYRGYQTIVLHSLWYDTTGIDDIPKWLVD